jgi:hypothetical protein
MHQTTNVTSRAGFNIHSAKTTLGAAPAPQIGMRRREGKPLFCKKAAQKTLVILGHWLWRQQHHSVG